MARTLASTVVVRHPVTMKVEALRKGTPLPDWAEGLVSEERLEPVDAPEIASVGDGTGVDGAPPVADENASSDAETLNRGGEMQVLERPHGNAGRDAWAAYAKALGLDVPADATKGDIKRLIGG